MSFTDILQAVSLGFFLSIVFIGPVFFLLIETSILKGWKSAIALNLGVIVSDIICILIAYYSQQDILSYMDKHPIISITMYRIGGLILCSYGLVMYFSKPKLHLNNTTIVSPNYFRTFLNGFLLNVVNIGVLLFWFFIVGAIAYQFPHPKEFILYVVIVLTTFFSIDLVKIFLAHSFQSKMTDVLVYKIRKIMGIILVIFGIILFLKSYGVFKSLDEKLHDNYPLKNEKNE